MQIEDQINFEADWDARKVEQGLQNMHVIVRGTQ